MCVCVCVHKYVCVCVCVCVRARVRAPCAGQSAAGCWPERSWVMCRKELPACGVRHNATDSAIVRRSGEVLGVWLADEGSGRGGGSLPWVKAGGSKVAGLVLLGVDRFVMYVLRIYACVRVRVRMCMCMQACMSIFLHSRIDTGRALVWFDFCTPCLSRRCE